MPWSTKKYDYKILHQIGSGSSAEVWKALYLVENIEVAIKIIELENSDIELDQFCQEISIMCTTEHVSY